MKASYLRSGLILSILLSLSIFLSSCAKPPKAEIESAEKALMSARSKEAHIYSEETYRKAEEALNKAHSFVSEKKYKEAKELAIEAEKLARQSEGEVEANKAKMKEETEKLLTDIRTSIEETKKILPLGVRKKVIAKEEAQKLIGKWETDLSSAKESLEMGKVREARDKAQSLLEEVRAKSEEIRK